MDLKLRRLQLVRGFNNGQDDRVSGSLRTRPVPRTVAELRNALPVPPTTSPGTQNGLSLTSATRWYKSFTSPSSHLSIFRLPAHRLTLRHTATVLRYTLAPEVRTCSAEIASFASHRACFLSRSPPCSSSSPAPSRPKKTAHSPPQSAPKSKK